MNVRAALSLRGPACFGQRITSFGEWQRSGNALFLVLLSPVRPLARIAAVICLFAPCTAPKDLRCCLAANRLLWPRSAHSARAGFPHTHFHTCPQCWVEKFCSLVGNDPLWEGTGRERHIRSRHTCGGTQALFSIFVFLPNRRSP